MENSKKRKLSEDNEDKLTIQENEVIEKMSEDDDEDKLTIQENELIEKINEEIERQERTPIEEENISPSELQKLLDVDSSKKEELKHFIRNIQEIDQVISTFQKEEEEKKEEETDKECVLNEISSVLLESVTRKESYADKVFKSVRSKGIKRNEVNLILATAERFNIEHLLLIGILDKITTETGMTIIEAIRAINTNTTLLSIDIEKENIHSYKLIFEAQYIYERGFIDETKYRLQYEPYLKEYLKSFDEVEDTTMVDDSSAFEESSAVKNPSIFSKIMALFTDSRFGNAMLQEEKEGEEGKGKKSSSISREISIAYFNQQSIGNCSNMVMTRIFIKIIEVLYLFITGKLLGKIKINNQSFQYIFTINNVFIMQYLGTYEKQTRYLAYLTNKYKKYFKGITENDLFVYIFIRFYLFMFILSLTDDIARFICSSMNCRLTYPEVCIEPEDTSNRGLNLKNIYTISNTLTHQLFPNTSMENIPGKIIENSESDEMIDTSKMAQKSSSKKLHGKAEERVCSNSPLKYIPDEVISSFLNPLFNLLSEKTKIKMEAYNRNSIGKWVYYPDYASVMTTSIGPAPAKYVMIDIDPAKENYGDNIYNKIIDELSKSKEQMVYLSISVILNKIKGFEGRSYTSHAYHALFILFINVTGERRRPDIKLFLQNSWGGSFANQELTKDEFKKYINEGSIFGFSYFTVEYDGTRLMGGDSKNNKNNKTKKRFNKSKRHNSRRRMKNTKMKRYFKKSKRRQNNSRRRLKKSRR